MKSRRTYDAVSSGGTSTFRRPRRFLLHLFGHRLAPSRPSPASASEPTRDTRRGVGRAGGGGQDTLPEAKAERFSSRPTLSLAPPAPAAQRPRSAGAVPPSRGIFLPIASPTVPGGVSRPSPNRCPPTPPPAAPSPPRQPCPGRARPPPRQHRVPTRPVPAPRAPTQGRSGPRGPSPRPGWPHRTLPPAAPSPLPPPLRGPHRPRPPPPRKPLTPPAGPSPRPIPPSPGAPSPRPAGPAAAP